MIAEMNKAAVTLPRSGYIWPTVRRYLGRSLWNVETKRAVAPPARRCVSAERWNMDKYSWMGNHKTHHTVNVARPPKSQGLFCSSFSDGPALGCLCDCPLMNVR